jgi:hypothetical protein
MTAALTANGHSLEARLNILAALLFGAAAAWTLWTGWLLLRAYEELATPSTRVAILLVVAAVAAAQCAAGFALLRRRWGGRWLAAVLSGLFAIVGLLGFDLITVLINTAALALVVRTWKFDPRTVAAQALPAAAGNSALAASAESAPDQLPRGRRRPVRYTLLFGLMFLSVYLPVYLLTRSTQVAATVLLSLFAAAAAWYVARTRPATPGGEGFAAFACAGVLGATLAASSSTTMIWLWMTAISIPGTPCDVPNINLVWIFAQAWISSWLAVLGAQYVLAWLSTGSSQPA